MVDSWIHRFAECFGGPLFLVFPIIVGFLLALLVGPLIGLEAGATRTVPCGSAPIETRPSIDGGQR